MTGAPLLDVTNVTVRFGGIVALDNVTLNVARGSIQAVIGPNGAGKSTLLNVITGLYAATEGAVSFEGEKIDSCTAHARTRMGIARTFQNTELFGEMSAAGERHDWPRSSLFLQRRQRDESQPPI